MRNLLILFCIVMLVACSERPTQPTPSENNMEILDSYGNIEILSEIIDAAKDKYDVDVVRLWSRDTVTGKMNKLIETVRDPEANAWYLPDGNRFVPISYDSIPVASFVRVWRADPLQLIVSGCPDMRNVHSFFIDVTSHKAWWIPSNKGFMGETEEGFMIFGSYRYVPDYDISGRYTFIQVFNDSGEMVDSLSLEHHHY